MKPIILRRLDVHYSGGAKESGWLLFEEGDIQHPLLYLDDWQIKKIISQYERQKEGAKP